MSNGLSSRLRPRVLGLGLHAAFALPRPVRRAIAGPPLRLDGQELALDAQLLLKLQATTGSTKLSAASTAKARAAMNEGVQMINHTSVPGVAVGERGIPTPSGELAARLYRPQELEEPGRLLLFFHGGGWVIGDLDSHDDLCRFLALHTGIRVLSVDYRLAPEHPFPAAFDDCLAAYRYAVDNARELGTEPGLVSVGGDSAGGNLAASVALHATRSGLPRPNLQFLLYPAVDATTRRRSRELFGNGLLLTDDDMDWFTDRYLPDVDLRADPRV